MKTSLYFSLVLYEKYVCTIYVELFVTSQMMDGYERGAVGGATQRKSKYSEKIRPITSLSSTNPT
jgi:hypothetical protein